MYDVDAGVDLLEDDGEYLKLMIETANRLSDVSSREDNLIDDGSEDVIEDNFEDDSEYGSKVGTDDSFEDGSEDYEEGYERHMMKLRKEKSLPRGRI